MEWVYIDKAVLLTKDIIKVLKENDNIKAEKNDVIKAIMLLKTTGANIIGNEDVKYYNDNLQALNPHLLIGDDKTGPIAITKATMDNNIYWAESRVVIDLDVEEIVFCAFHRAIFGKHQYVWNRRDRYNDTEKKAEKNYRETMAIGVIQSRLMLRCMMTMNISLIAYQQVMGKSLSKTCIKTIWGNVKHLKKLGMLISFRTLIFRIKK